MLARLAVIVAFASIAACATTREGNDGAGRSGADVGSTSERTGAPGSDNARTVGSDDAGRSGAVRTTRDGAFTAAQAERGKRVYDESCVSCHPAAYYEARLPVWQAAPVIDLFDALSATMPAENPGALATSAYLDVIAYILSITGSPAGEQELTLDNARAVLIDSD